jgi:hypothetical protein
VAALEAAVTVPFMFAAVIFERRLPSPWKKFAFAVLPKKALLVLT